MSLFRELKRRNVFRVGAAYVVVAWLIIQVVETIFPAFGFGDVAVRVATIALGIGLVPTLVFAWAFELTPEGLKKEKDVDRALSITPHTGKKLDRAIMVVLALAAGYFAFDNFVLDPQRETERQAEKAIAVEQAREAGRTEALVESFGNRSIAVLAFDDMSPESDQEYLSDGIAEELLNLLAKIPDLRVISRSSAFSFKGKDLEITEIAQRLNVAHILEGSVRKAGNRVRITAQLIEARSDTHLWSETYDRSLDDVFAIQDDIAAHVVDELKLQLLGEAPTSTRTNPEAYALVLQANQMADVLTPESLQGAVDKLKSALELDPQYARAWVNLSVAYDTLGVLGILTAEESKDQSLRAVRRALEIDPNDVSALSAMGHRFNDRGDKNMAAYHFQRAYTLDPANSQVIGDVSIFLGSLGERDAAIRLGERQVALDPANPVAYNNLGILYREAGNYEKAIETFEMARALSPTFGGLNYEIGAAHLLAGDAETALSVFANEGFEVFAKVGQSMALFSLGDHEASERLLVEITGEDGDYMPFYIAQVHAFRAEHDAAFRWLQQAKAAGDVALAIAIFDPLLANLHDDPRWAPFLASIGMAPDQLAAVDFDRAAFVGD